MSILSPYFNSGDFKPKSLAISGKMFLEMFVSFEGREESFRVKFSPEQQIILAEMFAVMFPPITPESKFNFRIEAIPFKISRPPNA